ncbi:MAG: carbohydrate porin [Acetobacteraceae bacterium]|nr:carbohydrate porin [Acetobacteraceae bacterium]
MNRITLDDIERVRAKAQALLRPAVCRFIAAALFLCWAVPGISQIAPNEQPSSTAPSERENPTPGPTGAGAPAQPPSPEAPTGFWERANLLDDLFGVRTSLAAYGISLGLQNTVDLFGNVTGGIKQGVAANGLAQFGIGLDTERAFGWGGGTFNASGLWIYGPNFNEGYLGTLQTVSDLIASPTVRLWELWYQQAFQGGRIDVKIGQQSLDLEFMTSQGASLFLNAALGWPVLASLDQYGGGPAYPLSSLGLRLRAAASDSVTILAGVFQDNPPGGDFYRDGQLLGATRYGFNFNMRTGALLIAEVQFGINPAPERGQADAGSTTGLTGTYKLGAWFDTAKFPDPRIDSTGLSLADPRSSGTARYHWHNYSLYAVADQTIWYSGPHALSVFLRPMGAPGDRNAIDFSLDGGMNLKSPLPDRDNDTFGIAFGVANVSEQARSLDRDAGFFSGRYIPVRGAETFLEATYQLQLTPWWQIQPDFQYFWMPAGGIVNPTDLSKRIGNEAVLGLRTSITF